jgi:type IX secretion system PorP/SprF family membrane protein
MSRNKLYIAISLSIILTGINPQRGFAQIDYRFSQFLQNPVPVNPAFSGIEDFVDLKLGYRTQWVGFDNAPTSMFLSGNMAMRITPGNNFKDRGVRIFEANAYNEKETDNEFGYRKGNRSGLGFYMLQNKDGGFNNLAVFANYAYHLRITNQLIWSVGVGFGYEYNKFDPSGISVLNPTNDPTYQSYLNNENTKSNININVGTIIYHRQFYLGYSAINAGTFNLSGDNTTYNSQVTQLTQTAQIGFNYRWRYGYLITPGVLIRMRPESPTEVIGTLRGRIHDRVWGGLQYTYLGSVGLSLGGYITPNIGFNYAYNFPTSQINRATAGSHEVILAIKLKNKNYSRAYLW